MTVDEYTDMAIAELKEFRKNWHEQHKKTPETYPAELDEIDWGEQEMASRFGG